MEKNLKHNKFIPAVEDLANPWQPFKLIYSKPSPISPHWADKKLKVIQKDAEIRIDEESRTDLHHFKLVISKGDIDKLDISEIINLIKNELKIEQHSDVELSDIHKRFRSLSAWNLKKRKINLSWYTANQSNKIFESK